MVLRPILLFLLILQFALGDDTATAAGVSGGAPDPADPADAGVPGGPGVSGGPPRGGPGVSGGPRRTRPPPRTAAPTPPPLTRGKPVGGNVVNATSVLNVFPLDARSDFAAAGALVDVQDKGAGENPKNYWSVFLWPRPDYEFGFFFSPSFEACQAIHVCEAEGQPTQDSEICLNAGSAVVFHPMENLVHVAGKPYNWIGPEVKFTPDGNGQFQLGVWAELTGETYRAPTINVSVNFDSSKWISILTSSPMCNPLLTGMSTNKRPYRILQKFTDSNNNAFISSATGMKKRFRDLILESELSATENADKDCCPRLWQSTLQPYAWNTVLNLINYQRYEVAKRSSACTDTEGVESMISVVLQGDDLHRCQWFRLCFGNRKDPGAKKFCDDSKPSFELFPRLNMYIPTDDDSARLLMAKPSQLTGFRLRFFPKLKLMQLGYVMLGRRLTAVHDIMSLDWNPFKDGATIDFAFTKCRIRIASEFLSASQEKAKKVCLAVKDCACLKPKGGPSGIASKPNQFGGEGIEKVGNTAKGGPGPIGGPGVSGAPGKGATGKAGGGGKGGKAGTTPKGKKTAKP